MIAQLAHDPHLPGFKAALDAAAMTGALNRQFSRASINRSEVTDCQIERFRYREGTRAVIQYRVTLATDDGPGVPVWASGTLYRGDKAKRIAGEVASDKAGASALAFHEPFTDMFFQLCPFDRHMPELAKLCDPHLLAMSGLLPDGDGVWRIDHDPVRYRPGVSATLRCSDANNTLVFTKTAREGSAKERFARLRALSEAPRRANSPEMPTPVGYSDALRATSTACVSGQSLDMLMATSPYVTSNAARLVGASLAAFHASEINMLPVRGPDGFGQRARKQASFVRWALPSLAGLIGNVLSAAQDGFDDSERRPSHLDMKPDHVFVEGESCAFIDVDSMALADPVADPAMMAARIDALHELEDWPVPVIRMVRHNFLDAYFSATPAARASRFRAFYAASALKVSLYFVQHLVPEMEAKVRRTLERALVSDPLSI